MQGFQNRSALPEINPLRQDIIFGGEKGALNAPPGVGPKQSADAASALEQNGISAAEIFKHTGWYRGPDQSWKWILSDKGADLNPDVGTSTPILEGVRGLKYNFNSGDPRKLPEVLNHPSLYTVYPQLKDTTIERMPTGQAGYASYDPTTNKISVMDGRPKKDIVSSILHELQHGVQGIEGFGEGGNALMYLPADVLAGKRSMTDEDRRNAYESYSRLSGEVEAFQVQRQFAAQNWTQLPTRMQGFHKPDEQLVKRDSSLEVGKSYKQFVPVDHKPNFVDEPLEPPQNIARYEAVDYNPF